MPTTRLFAYLPPGGPQPLGVSQYDNIMVQDFSDPTSPSVGLLGYEWFYGPDEELAYIISHESGPKTRGGGTGLITGTCVGWWKSKAKTEASFTSLTKMIAAKYSKQITIDDGRGNFYPFDPTVGLSGYGAKTWLADKVVGLNFWSSFPDPNRYQYYKWRITELKGATSSSTGVAEFRFFVDGVTQSVVGYGVTGASGSFPEERDPSKLIDNNLFNITRDINFGANRGFTEFIFDVGDTKVFNGYNWATGETTTEDPKTWTLQGSSDNIHWTTLHTVTRYEVTNERQAWVGIFSY